MNFECFICQRVCSTERGLKKHMAVKHPSMVEKIKKSEKFQCELCLKFFESKSMVLTHKSQFHIESGALSNVFKCSTCQSTCFSETGLQRHIIKMHPELVNERNFQCLVCQRVCTTERGLKQHMKIKHPSVVQNSIKFHCRLCNIEFESKNSLVKHKEQTHTDPSEKFQCDVCLKLFGSKSGMLSHKRQFHIESVALSNVFKCSTCQSTCFSKTGLQRHIIKMHPELVNESDMFDCNICQKKCASKATLLRHKYRVHAESSSVLKCSTCQKVCFSETGLQRHIYLEHSHEDKKFQCDLCDKKFVEKFTLVFHKRQKHSESSDIFQCGSCNKKFVSKITLKNHKKIVHSESRLEKRFEEFAFSSFKEFENWKIAVEDESVTRFVKAHGQYICKDYVTIYFACFRNGTFRPKLNRTRRVKIQGSAKINGSCKAMISAKIFNTGEIKVLFQSIHHGHGADQQHLFFRDKEKSEIAKMIQLDIPYNTILSILKRKPRYKLLTRQDLYNIKRSRRIGDSLHKNDVLSLKGLVADNEAVKYVKFSGEPCRFGLLDEQTGVSVSKSEQLVEARKYFKPEDVIGIDSTHGLNSYGIKLTNNVFKCSTCLKYCFSETGLQNHIIRMHPELVNESDIFDCNICQKKFASKATLLRHKNRVHAESSNVFKCSTCQKNCFSETGLQNHIIRMHPQLVNESDMFDCNICQKKFASKATLLRHKYRVHAESSSVLKCSTCQKVCFSETGLQRHIYFKHSYVDKRARRDLCDKQFVEKPSTSIEDKIVPIITKEMILKKLIEASNNIKEEDSCVLRYMFKEVTKMTTVMKVLMNNQENGSSSPGKSNEDLT